MRWLGGITVSVHMNWSKLQEMVKDGEAWWPAVHGITKSRTQLSHWTSTESVFTGAFGYLFWAFTEYWETVPQSCFSLCPADRIIDCLWFGPFFPKLFFLISILDRQRQCHYSEQRIFFFSFIFISWRIITSQHCSGFCHILTWIFSFVIKIMVLCRVKPR